MLAYTSNFTMELVISFHGSMNELASSCWHARVASSPKMWGMVMHILEEYPCPGRNRS